MNIDTMISHGDLFSDMISSGHEFVECLDSFVFVTRDWITGEISYNHFDDSVFGCVVTSEYVRNCLDALYNSVKGCHLFSHCE